jgi:glycosyltransferase involved in cell wall biosynthesis
MLSSRWDKFLYRLGLRLADKITVQSHQQNLMLDRQFGLKGSLIKNFSLHPSKRNAADQKKTILWVSTIKQLKRPKLFLQLAEAFPDESFIMIGGAKTGETDLYDKVREKAQAISNLDFLGFQPLNVTEQYFDQCKIFINTSEKEGFPNTFLQAWRRGIPVVSSVDPDQIIAKNQLGKFVTPPENFRRALHEMLTLAPDLEDTIIDYYEQNHSRNNIEKLETLFSSF